MIAITGIGIVAPVGVGARQALDSYADMRPGISGPGASGPASESGYPAGVVRNFRARDFVPAMAARRMSRFSAYAVASSVEAFQGSGFVISDDNRAATAIAVGAALGSTGSTDTFYEGLLREGPEGTNPMVFPETVQNIAASHIAMHFGLTGPNITFSQCDTSSEAALAYCCSLLAGGSVDAALVCGADELSSCLISGYASLGLLSESMRPFDRGRSGFIAAEGGAALLLERAEDARRRGADIHAIISSVSLASAPAGQMRHDSSRGSMIKAMSMACAESGIAGPGWIAASANGSRELDALEAEAICEVFGRQPDLPVTALRAYNGYFPSDGMLRIASAALCMNHGIVPAVPGLADPLHACMLNYVMHRPLRQSSSSVMVNSFSAGGTSASVMLKKA